MVHADKGSQYCSRDFRSLLLMNNCIQSMSRRRNCWDNAVDESFFSSLNMERIKRRFIKYEKWHMQMCLIISRCFSIESDVIRILMG